VSAHRAYANWRNFLWRGDRRLRSLQVVTTQQAAGFRDASKAASELLLAFHS
jgi:hypothetical protein